MNLLIFIAGMMVGGTVAIALHCILIIGKQSDEENVKK